MALQDQLEAIRTDLEARIPDAAKAIMHRATDELIASGMEQRIASSGSAFPDFSLHNQDNSVVSSAALFATKPTVITFYRGLWCPYCNADLKYIGGIQDEVERLGGQLIAISPQLATWSQKVRAQNALGFDILHDAGNELAHQLGLRFRLPDDLLALYRDGFHIDLPRYHGEDSWTLPMPARFVIDATQTIRYAEASADYTRRPDPDAMLAVLADITA